MFALIRRRQFYSDWSTFKWFQTIRHNLSRKNSTKKISAFLLCVLVLFAAFIGRHFQVEKCIVDALYFRTYVPVERGPVNVCVPVDKHVCTWNVTRHNYCGLPQCGRETRNCKSGKNNCGQDFFLAQ